MTEIENAPKSKKLSLRANFVWVASGTVVGAATQLLLMAIIQKMAGTVALGNYALALAISMPVYLLMGLSLRYSMVIDVNDVHSFGEYLGVRLFLNVMSILTVLGIVGAKKLGTEMLVVALLVSTYHGTITTSQLFEGVYQKHECMSYLGISRALNGVFSIPSVLLGFWIVGTLVGGLVFLCVAMALKILLYDVVNARRYARVSPSFSAELLWTIFKKCWVISLSAGLVSLGGNVPRYLIEDHLGRTALGFFTGITITIFFYWFHHQESHQNFLMLR